MVHMFLGILIIIELSKGDTSVGIKMENGVYFMMMAF